MHTLTRTRTHSLTGFLINLKANILIIYYYGSISINRSSISSFNKSRRIRKCRCSYVVVVYFVVVIVFYFFIPIVVVVVVIYVVFYYYSMI